MANLLEGDRVIIDTVMLKKKKKRSPLAIQPPVENLEESLCMDNYLSSLGLFSSNPQLIWLNAHTSKSANENRSRNSARSQI